MVDKVRVSSEVSKNEGTLVIEPLPQSYGVTLGNSLRRVLLTSLPGAAITQVKISGVTHEYSTIRGVKEDIVEIILNLKGVRLKVDSDKPVKLSLDVKGAKEVLAKDIEVPGDVEIANPDHYICSLADSKTKLSISMKAEKGFGYAPVENRRSLGVGVIPLDATFSPVTKVSYKVEATRVGQITNFDKLILSITTDGTITPQESVKQASKILTDYFNVLVEQRKPSKEDKIEKPPRPKIEKDALVEELELSTRITNSLRNAGIDTVEKLQKTTKEESVKLKNMGAKSISDIEEKLKEKGLTK